MATSYAVISNGVVVEIIAPLLSAAGIPAPITDRFTPAFIRTLVAIPSTQAVAVGWTYLNGVFAAPVAASAAVKLAAAQTVQIANISSACQAAIYTGFTSSALGSKHNYPFQDKDQTNLTDSVLAANQALNGGVWVANEEYYVNSSCVMNGVVYRCVLTGKTAATQPVFPTTIGAVVTDGTTQWSIWETPFWCEDTSGVWAWRYHNVKQMQRAGLDGMTWKLSCMGRNAALAAEVAACTTIAAVQAINW